MSLQVHEFPNGDVAIGVEIDGAFVPFASQSAARIAQYVERGQGLAERAEAGDEAARDLIGKPIGSSNGSAKPVSKMTSDELDAHAAEIGVADYPADATVAEKKAAIKAHEDAGEEG